MDLALIGLARNDGEMLLTRLLEDLRRSPAEPDDLARFERAVIQMLNEEDAGQRVEMFNRALGIINPEGRPPSDYKSEKYQRHQAFNYWIARLFDGMRKGEAVEHVAIRCQISGEYPDGQPAARTVRRNISRQPREAVRVFRTWCNLAEPSEEEREKARKDIQEFLAKNV